MTYIHCACVYTVCVCTLCVCVCVCVCCHLSRVQFFVTLRTIAHQAPLSINSPGKNTGVDCHALRQGIFPTQGSNPGLPHYRQILYHLSHQESPRILEWVAYAFSRGIPLFWACSWRAASSQACPCLGLIPTQELNPSVLLCRQILYQLSYQGSPGGCSGKES